MPYTPLANTFYMDPKIRRLAKVLDLDIRLAHAMPAMLWSWSVSFAPDGELTKYDFESIEDLIYKEFAEGFTIDSAALISELRRFAFEEPVEMK